MKSINTGWVAGIASGFGTAYLIVYIIILHSENNLNIAFTLFAFSPLVLIGMVYSIIKYGRYNGRELKEGEEWGYEDKFNDR